MNRSEKAKHAIQARVYRDAIGLPPESKWKGLLPLLTEQGYAARILRKKLDLSTPLNTEDRRVLEQVIFPYYRADATFRTVLFVGCGTYTSHYQRKYLDNKIFWTIEPDAGQRKFGAAQHVIAPLEEVGKHFKPGFFDLIICNGVLGWGLDRLEQCEAAISQTYDVLRSGGHFVFGWDDVPRRTPVQLSDVKALTKFQHFEFPPLGTWRYLTDTPYRHTFDFYLK